MFGMDLTDFHAVVRMNTHIHFKEREPYIAQATGTLINYDFPGGKRFALVTNKHVLNPLMSFPAYQEPKIVKIECELREFNDKKPTGATHFFETTYDEIIFSTDGVSDIACLYSPSWEILGTKFLFHTIDEMEVADEYFWENQILPYEQLTFIGFPKTWFDKNGNFPIARSGNLASVPCKRYENDKIKGNCLLITGLSFEGSSGSPVLSLRRYGLHKGQPVLNEILPSRLLGIMSGHLVDERNAHAGLSYFIKSGEVKKLLNECRKRDFNKHQL